MDINLYANKLMENLPTNITNASEPLKVDLILGGGAFNGSYILGALYFLKEMERKNYIYVRRISTCSISSIMALLYLTDNLDKANELYFDIVNDFKKKGNLSNLLTIKQKFKDVLKDDACHTLNKKLYICYNNISKFKKCVVNKYKNADHLFEIMTRSGFMPFMINFNPSYKNKYIDGITPYFFKNNDSSIKILYFDVYTIDKIVYSLNIRNEKNNYHRLFEGMLDIHKFFIKNCNTTMCSDTSKWGVINYLTYYIYLLIGWITLYLMGIICIFTNIFQDKYELIKPIIAIIIRFFLKNFCF